MRLTALLIVLIIIISSSLKTNAGVNPRNGNFYVSYTDLTFKETNIKFEICRTYNSKIIDAGWFGAGWGCDFETFLFSIPGGGVYLKSGPGKSDIQNPASWNLDDISKCVDELIEVMKAEGVLLSADEIIKKRNKLINNMESRNFYWHKYLKSGKVKNIKLEPGTKLFSSCNCGGFTYLFVTENGYKRKNISGITEFFDNNGKLIKLEDEKGNWIKLEFNDSLNIKSMQDNIGNALFFKTNLNGQVLRIEDNKKRILTYKYENLNLVYSCDANANIYRFTYDSKSNLTSSIYMDNSKMTLEYDKDGNKVTSVTTRDGNRTEYSYTSRNDHDYCTMIIYKNNKDSVFHSENRCWLIKNKENGGTWTYKEKVTKNDNDTLIKIFDEQLELVDTIIHNREITSLEYDIRGMLLKIVFNGKSKAQLYFSGNYKLNKVITATDTFYFNYSEDNKPVSINNFEGNTAIFPIDPAQTEIISMLKNCYKILSQADLTYYFKIWYSPK